jgi:hypothetical protein
MRRIDPSMSRMRTKGDFRLRRRDRPGQRGLATRARPFDHDGWMDGVGSVDAFNGLLALDHWPNAILEKPIFNSGFS